MQNPNLRDTDTFFLRQVDYSMFMLIRNLVIPYHEIMKDILFHHGMFYRRILTVSLFLRIEAPQRPAWGSVTDLKGGRCGEA